MTLLSSRAIIGDFYRALSQDTGQSWISQVSMLFQSNQESETYAWLGALPGLRQLVGEVNIRNLANHGFSVANIPFELTVGVKREDIERDNLNLYSNWFSASGRRAQSHPDKLLAAAFTGGFTTLCYTGKNFFDLNHEPQKGKGKFSNKGTKKLSAANFEAAVESMLSRKDAEGEPINEDPKLVLIVAPKWQATAEAILVAKELVGGGTNTNAGKARLDVWSRLAGAATEDMWFLIDEGADVKPFVHQVEVPLEFKTMDNPDSEHAMIKQEYLYQVYGRHNVAALVPELAYGSTGADPA